MSLRTANQPPPLAEYDLFSENRPLVEALEREGGAHAVELCADFGRLCGGQPLELGRLANEHPPVLHTHDRFGERIDEVEFHPAWHALLGLGVEHGLHATVGGHLARAALFMTLAYAEAGVGCPLSMTYAAVPALRVGAPELAAAWEPLLASTAYEPGLLPPAEKRGAL
jgi:putative acyl-CoA dehydrogenase